MLCTLYVNMNIILIILYITTTTYSRGIYNATFIHKIPKSKAKMQHGKDISNWRSRKKGQEKNYKIGTELINDFDETPESKNGIEILHAGFSGKKHRHSKIYGGIRGENAAVDKGISISRKRRSENKSKVSH